MGTIPRRVVAPVVLLCAALATGCATLPTGIARIDEHGKTVPITVDELNTLSGGDQPYLLQVGDEMDLTFRVKNFAAGETPWDYRLEVGDSMEVRLSPETFDSQKYLIDTGDIIGVSFLNNWPLNVTRTVRPDGKISLIEVGDVQAAGVTAEELRHTLDGLYAKTGLIEGDPSITVNVDFVNLDRLESVSRDVVVRPDGKIRLPGFKGDVPVAGLTVSEAAAALSGEIAKFMLNKPVVGIVVFPNINASLQGLNGRVTVRPDGRISVPRIGDIPAAGYGVEEFRARLTEASQRVLFNPIDPAVNVVNATGARIYVGGEVGLPGVYPLESTPTALQAIMLAKGAQNTARLRQVIVVRRNPAGKPFVFKTDLHAALYRGQTENDIPLRPFDLVYVPKKLVSKANLFVEQYIDRMVPFDNSLGVNGSYYLNEQRVDSKSRNRSVNLNLGPGSFVATP